MPRCLEPGQKFPLELESEHGTRVFTFRAISVRDYMAAREKIDANPVDGIVELLQATICGWENVKDIDGNEVAFSRDALLDVVTQSGLAQLYRGFSLGPEDKKKSE